MTMMNPEVRTQEMEKLHDVVRAISRTNFYLWMYLAQEGIFDDAHEFLRDKLESPLPVEVMLGIQPWLEPDTVGDSPFDCF